MGRVAYVNGQYLPLRDAGVSIEDRGYQFADGVYEVIYCHGGRLIDADGHLARLARSLAELSIAAPMTGRALAVVIAETIRRNGIRNGIVYLQVTRGVARRDHPFPKGIAPSLVVTARPFALAKPEAVAAGVRVITIPDRRWQRCDIKSIALLPNVLGKQTARERGAYEAWQVDSQGQVTEGTSTNAWIVTRDGTIVTRETGHAILSGITRAAVIALARAASFDVVERPFGVAEAREAAEAFLTSTTSLVMPVVGLDGALVGTGRPGPVALALRDLYVRKVLNA